ncbi:hypothetical protein DNL40_08760 [Xylanimonas oleitrophica]|uniref:Zinc-finger domain-containing protein n=1 Tax=Xylanimonas oleitrophica TaxID=2607479 RepID=A0A2W5WNH2_9MICO|nr:zf-HC2 domain-containing protein [Xylanimonas oleitrophica]PZR53089.1 hypothetical protein DNL40_08760 [Xylanimonas oleitrophica]
MSTTQDDVAHGRLRTGERAVDDALERMRRLLPGTAPGEPGSAEPDLVRTALAGLHHDHQRLLWLRHVDGRSDAEVAGALGLPLGSVRRGLREAERALSAGFAAAHARAAASAPQACATTRGALGDYVRHRVAPQARRVLEDHLFGCQDCMRAFIDVRQAAWSLRDAAPVLLAGSTGLALGGPMVYGTMAAPATAAGPLAAIGSVGVLLSEAGDRAGAAVRALSSSGRRLSLVVGAGVVAVVAAGAVAAAVVLDDDPPSRPAASAPGPASSQAPAPPPGGGAQGTASEPPAGALSEPSAAPAEEEAPGPQDLPAEAPGEAAVVPQPAGGSAGGRGEGRPAQPQPLPEAPQAADPGAPALAEPPAGPAPAELPDAQPAAPPAPAPGPEVPAAPTAQPTPSQPAQPQPSPSAPPAGPAPDGPTTTRLPLTVPASCVPGWLGNRVPDGTVYHVEVGGQVLTGGAGRVAGAVWPGRDGAWRVANLRVSCNAWTTHVHLHTAVPVGTAVTLVPAG